VGPVNYIYLADHSFETAIPGHDHYSDDLVFSPSFQGGPYYPPKPFDPGPLLPNTTYHWTTSYCNIYNYHSPCAYSEAWSFTTTDPITTEQTTWGKVKALYR
jgi:hypothetical protein